MTAEPDVLAAELALGLLEGTEQAEALRRAAADPAFAAEVERWRLRFASLYAEVPAVEPDPALEHAILLPTAANDAGPWRWATAIASAIAACLLAFIVLRPPAAAPPPITVSAPVPTPAPPQLAAAMSPTAAKAKPFGAIYDPASGEVKIAPGVDLPKGKAAQLWLIGADGVPKPIGLLEAERPSHIVLTIADRRTIGDGITLAISIEPPGGSPTGKPTGPVVATGALSTV